MISPAFTIIGERINSSRKLIARAIETRDEAYIRQEARIQAEAGADCIDVNAGTFLGEEKEILSWLVRTVQAVVNVPLSLDSPDAAALAAGAEEHRGAPIINSITLEPERMKAVLPVVLEHSCKVIAIPVDGLQVPATAEHKCELALRLVGALEKAGVQEDDIYIDPIIQPISTTANAGAESLAAISMLRSRLPGVHVLCGVRNISFHMPHRPMLDTTFLAMAMAAGADTAILDPCDAPLMSVIAAAEAVLGIDEFGIRFIAASRNGCFDG